MESIIARTCNAKRADLSKLVVSDRQMKTSKFLKQIGREQSVGNVAATKLLVLLTLQEKLLLLLENHSWKEFVKKFLLIAVTKFVV
jgi:hypothetical protein